MRMTKLLALAAVALVAAACTGISPTSPGATVASDDATAPADTKAWQPVPPPECVHISDVKMLLFFSPVPSPIRGIKVRAAYFSKGEPSKCGVAPVWSSKPLGWVVPTRDPFVGQVNCVFRPSAEVLLMARAPNGVQGSIQVGCPGPTPSR